MDFKESYTAVTILNGVCIYLGSHVDAWLSFHIHINTFQTDLPRSETKEETDSPYRISVSPLSVLKMMKTLHRHYKHGCAANLDFDWVWHVGIYCHSKGRGWCHHLFARFAVFFNDC